MAAGGLSLPEVRNECTICLEFFKSPKLLPCFHTFCAVCLEKYIDKTKRGKRFECPLCRKEIDVPGNGVEELQTNFYIDEKRDEGKRETIPCEGCSEKPPADHFCLDCEEHFCPRCTDVHTTMKATRKHKLKEIGTTEPKAKIKARVFCTKHPNKEIEVICKQCDQLLCVLCMLLEHQSHKFKEISEEATEARKTLRAKIEETPVSEVVRKKDKSVQILQETNEKLEVALKEDVEVVKKRCEEVQQSAIAIAKKLRKDLKKEYGRVIDANKGKIKQLEITCASFVSLGSTVEQVLELDNDVAILEKSSTLCQQLDGEKNAHKTEFSEKNVSEMKVGRALVQRNTSVQLDVEKLYGRIEQIEIVPSKPKSGCMLLSATPALSNAKSLQVIPISSELKCASRFQVPGHEKATIYSVVPISKGRAWVAFFFYASGICLVDIEGKLLKTASVKTCYSVTTDEKDNCIACCQEDNSIKRVTVSGTVETITRLSHIDGWLGGLAYRKTSDGREILLFSCFSVLKSDNPVFAVPYAREAEATTWSLGYKSPYSIAVDDVKGNVCVGDYGSGVCVILDETGKELCRYKPSSPVYGVCFDRQGCFIVTNDCSKAACRITADGKFVEDLPAITGRRAAVDANNRIWVGSKNGRVDVYEIV